MIDQLIQSRLDRRALLTRVAGGAAAAFAASSLGVLAGCGGSGFDSIVDDNQNIDVDVLNFALNLEYLEAEFYLRAVNGTGLDAADVGAGAGAVTGGRQVNFGSVTNLQLANEIANDELAHVRFLRSALGGSAVARPAIDLQTSFNTAAQAAGIGNTFDPFADEASFFIAAFIFEDVGVTAYKGASPLITNKTYLEAAAGILGTEAYHAGVVRFLLNQLGTTALDAAAKISNLRDALDRGEDTDQPPYDGALNVVPTDSNGITYSRSTREVLNIVYGAQGAAAGLFFPNGLNGNIK